MKCYCKGSTLEVFKVFIFIGSLSDKKLNILD